MNACGLIITLSVA